MTVGIMHIIECHVTPETTTGALTLDKWNRVSFSYESAFTNGEAIVTRGDPDGDGGLGYTVKLKYLNGQEPAATQTRTAIITAAKAAIVAALGEGSGYTLAG